MFEFSVYWWLPLLLSVVSDQIALRSQWSPVLKVSFLEKSLSLNFQYMGVYLCCSQWSVIRHAGFFPDLFLYLDKCV